MVGFANTCLIGRCRGHVVLNFSSRSRRAPQPFIEDDAKMNVRDVDGRATLIWSSLTSRTDCVRVLAVALHWRSHGRRATARGLTFDGQGQKQRRAPCPRVSAASYLLESLFLLSESADINSVAFSHEVVAKK